MRTYTIVLEYKGREYAIEDSSPHYRNDDDVIDIWTEGNFGCDCNRSDFINRKLSSFPIMDCGEEIQLVSIARVIYPREKGE